MTLLYGRKATLVVDTLELSEFDFEFDVTRTLKKNPNTAEIRVFNLAKRHRGELSSKPDVFVDLRAGYGDRLATIYSGSLRDAWHDRDEADWITVITSGDGEKQRRQRRVQKTIAPKTKLDQALTDLTGELGIGIGNAVQALKGAQLRNEQAEFALGAVFSGNPFELLDQILKSAGKEYSIQNGELQVLDINSARLTPVVLLNKDTGLIGVPEKGAKNTVKLRALLQPDLEPGSRVRVQTEAIDGVFRIERVDYRGDTMGGSWFADLQTKEVPS